MIESWMLPIPGGQIQLRDDRKKSRWQAQLEPFLLSKFLVTHELYADLMAMNPSCFAGQQCPVESVSWFDALRFCNALSERSGLSACYLIEQDQVRLLPEAKGYRLPTDAIDDLGFRVARSL